MAVTRAELEELRRRVAELKAAKPSQQEALAPTTVAPPSVSESVDPGAFTADPPVANQFQPPADPLGSGQTISQTIGREDAAGAVAVAKRRLAELNLKKMNSEQIIQGKESLLSDIPIILGSIVGGVAGGALPLPPKLRGKAALVGTAAGAAAADLAVSLSKGKSLSEATQQSQRVFVNELALEFGTNTIFKFGGKLTRSLLNTPIGKKVRIKERFQTAADLFISPFLRRGIKESDEELSNQLFEAGLRIPKEVIEKMDLQDRASLRGILASGTRINDAQLDNPNGMRSILGTFLKRIPIGGGSLRRNELLQRMGSNQLVDELQEDFFLQGFGELTAREQELIWLDAIRGGKLKPRGLGEAPTAIPRRATMPSGITNKSNIVIENMGRMSHYQKLRSSAWDDFLNYTDRNFIESGTGKFEKTQSFISPKFGGTPGIEETGRARLDFTNVFDKAQEFLDEAIKNNSIGPEGTIAKEAKGLIGSDVNKSYREANKFVSNFTKSIQEHITVHGSVDPIVVRFESQMRTMMKDLMAESIKSQPKLVRENAEALLKTAGNWSKVEARKFRSDGFLHAINLAKNDPGKIVPWLFKPENIKELADMKAATSPQEFAGFQAQYFQNVINEARKGSGVDPTRTLLNVDPFKKALADFGGTDSLFNSDQKKMLENIISIEDLRGKNLAVTGIDQTPTHVFSAIQVGLVLGGGATDRLGGSLGFGDNETSVFGIATGAAIGFGLGVVAPTMLAKMLSRPQSARAFNNWVKKSNPKLSALQQLFKEQERWRARGKKTKSIDKETAVAQQRVKDLERPSRESFGIAPKLLFGVPKSSLVPRDQPVNALADIKGINFGRKPGTF